MPFLRCYCSICRKTAGGSGYAINLVGKADTLKVTGKRSVATFHALIDGEEQSGERSFCRRCGSALWVFSPGWPELIHPFASAVDTLLPEPPEQVHMMLGSKATWVRDEVHKGETNFDAYPDQSLQEWHRGHRLLEE